MSCSLTIMPVDASFINAFLIFMWFCTVYSNGRQTTAHRHVSCGSSGWIALSQIDEEFLPHLMLFYFSMCLCDLVRLVTRESSQLDNKDSEPKAQVKLQVSRTKLKFLKETNCQKLVIFRMPEWE